jgi:hypothetical protein
MQNQDAIVNISSKGIGFDILLKSSASHSIYGHASNYREMHPSSLTQSPLRPLLRFREWTFSLVLSILSGGIGLLAVQGQEFDWKNVAIGGGGYVTGLIMHPLDANLVYARTDIGGAYRWETEKQRWIPITDWISLAKANLFGVDSIAVDPSNVDTVYISCGKNLTGEPKGIFKSIDQGKTWEGPYLTDVATAGNDVLPTGVAYPPLRNAGERLVVDPHDGNVLYFGSRKDGLWMSSNAGVDWTHLNLPTEGNPGYGISFVALDPTSGKADHKCTRIYVGVFGALPNDSGCGIYRSEDSGMSWERLRDPENIFVTQPRRGQCSPVNGTLWVTHTQGVLKVSSSSNLLINVTPAQASNSPYNALALDPSDATKVVVIEGFMRSNNRIYRTQDTGNTWIQVSDEHHSSVPWWYDKMWAASPSSALISKFDSHELWYADWYGVWRAGDYIAETSWSNLETGHEEVYVFSLICPPAPATTDLFSGVADVEGFRHENGPDSYPGHSFGTNPDNGPNTDFQSTFGLDYCESSPINIVRASGSQGGGAGVCKSHDGGVTWVFCSGWDMGNLPRTVAVSASNPDIFIITVSGDKPRITTDGGKTFRTCDEISSASPSNFWSTSQPLTADRVNPEKFYYYVSGKLYSASGENPTFELQTDSLLNTDHATLRAKPGSENEIWIGFRQNGLWRSTDGGKTFREIKSPAGTSIDVQSFAFGKSKDNTNCWLYLLGTLDGQSGVQLSKDDGTTWSWISSDREIGCSPKVIEASRQILGRIYVGTAGRGILQGNGKVPVMPTQLAAIPENSRIRLNWNTTPNAVTYTIKRADSAGGDLKILSSGLSSTEYIDTTISPGVTYRYVVTAVNDFGNSPDSQPVFATNVASSTLAPPTIAPPQTASHRVTLRWNASPNALGYRLEKAASNNGSFEPLTTTSALTYTDTSVENGITYSFRIKAFNAVEDSFVSNIISATPLMSYADFKAKYFGAATPDDISGPLADPGGSGTRNILIYAFGGNPWNADKSILPTLTVNQSESTFKCFRRSTSDLTYTIEYSTDLKHWTSSPTYPPNIEYSQIESDLTGIIIRQNISNSTQNFIRIRVDY